MSAFRPAQAQRWNLYAGFQAAMDAPAARRELWGWCALALLSLAVAGVFALLVALSRVPGFADVAPLPVQFFQKGLVVHVVFSFVVWYLSVMGAMSCIAAHRIAGGRARGAALGRLAQWCGFAGAVLLFVSGFMDRGAPSLNNYVPMLMDPIYYAGLGALAAGVALASARLLICIPGRDGPLEPVSVGAVNAALLFALALVCVGVAATSLAGDPVDGAYFEHLFWGGGHVLQFVNVSLLLGAWYVLGGLALEMPLVRPNQLSLAQVLVLGAALLAPLFYVLFPAFSVDQAAAFTWLQYGLAPPTLIAA
ncbi:MAG: cbb3-type cytochrome c oxidase subunit I, partial [Rhodospirillaceae bacterium]